MKVVDEMSVTFRTEESDGRSSNEPTDKKSEHNTMVRKVSS